MTPAGESMQQPTSDPLWFKDAVIYQLHVRAFHDSNGDGIGDFRGVIEKLDYLRQLGVTTLWLLPFYPSPLRDDGYDIADYMSVNPSYGTLEDFKEFLDEAHARGLRVITELVLNHTSDMHPWFQRARKAPKGSPERDFYVWSDTPTPYSEARIIFKDFEHSNWSWDPVASSYFWHRFYSHQPDLNWDNPAVEKAMFKVFDYWLKMGVDGLRLDAVPYLIEREGTNCENLPETHAILRRLRAHIDAKFSDRMLLAEANQWPEDAAAYFGKGDGDECHMTFHFPVMPRLFMALQMEDRFPIIDILEQTPKIPANAQWAMFLRNHDELTLEMVTDEERDYMYRMYASDHRARINLGIRRRLAPLLRNSRRKIELMNVLLLSLTGTPIIYYGDEIGMGDNIYLGDRNGVRTPMQWSADRNAGFSRASSQQLFLPVIRDSEYAFEAINVEAQERNLSSLLWWTRRTIAMRQRFQAFGRGSIEFVPSDNPRLLTFVRELDGETLLVMANLSRFSQAVEIDLSRWVGMCPVEVFSQNRFPVIKSTPYFLSFGPHDYYWLTLQPEQEPLRIGPAFDAPALSIAPKWDAVLASLRGRKFQEKVLPDCLQHCRWFGGKAHSLTAVKVVDNVPLGTAATGNDAGQLMFLEAVYLDIAPETYLLPLQIASAEQAQAASVDNPLALVAQLRSTDGENILFDALDDESFRSALLEVMAQHKRVPAGRRSLVGRSSAAFREAAAGLSLPLPSRALKAEQSNSSVIYDNRFFLKLYRKPEEGQNPDVELIRYLSESRKFANVPAYCGSIECNVQGGAPRVIALLVELVPNEGDAYSLTLDALGRYVERVLSKRTGITQEPNPELVAEIIGGVMPERIRLLGQRTAEMHLALATETEDPDFAPEPFTTLHQRSLYQSMRGTTRRMIQFLKKKVPHLAEAHREEAAALLGMESDMLSRQADLLNHKVSVMKIRVHGDYHLGQVLSTGKDFMIIDFEGEPARSIGERRMKRSALQDVAGMVRSFHYAAQAAFSRHVCLHLEDAAFLQPWMDRWVEEIERTFLEAYYATAAGASFIPKDPAIRDMLLTFYLLGKAVYEVIYELNNRPHMVDIPMRGIRKILAATPRTGES
jgi:maltose alpha-D-glucosyltransferase/alpha-amylase